MHRRMLVAGSAAIGMLSVGRSSGAAGPALAGTVSGRGAIPNLPVVTHEGRQAAFYDDLVRDKVVTINFFFAQCGGVCPLVTENLRQVQGILDDRVGRDLFMYSITLKPEEERPDLLATYAEMHDIRPGWLLLTGEPAQIEQLRVALGFTDPDPSLDAIDDSHLGILRFGNDRLGRWGACPGLGRPEWIARTIVEVMLE